MTFYSMPRRVAFVEKTPYTLNYQVFPNANAEGIEGIAVCPLRW